MTDAAEPTLNQKLEAMRTAVAFIRMINDNRYDDLLTYFSTLDAYEQGCALGALAQLSLVGVYAVSAVRHCSLEDVLNDIDAQFTANTTGKHAS